MKIIQKKRAPYKFRIGNLHSISVWWLPTYCLSRIMQRAMHWEPYNANSKACIFFLRNSTFCKHVVQSENHNQYYPTT